MINEHLIIWVIGPHEKPNVGIGTIASMSKQIITSLNEGKEVRIVYKWNNEPILSHERTDGFSVQVHGD